jgi:L-alanine-DL-glutamate epimerase-like enolase superfamily enzyme
MRIIDVKTYLLERPVHRVRTWRRGQPAAPLVEDLCWLRVLTDEGIDGWALSDRGHVIAELTRKWLRLAAIGKDPLMKEELWGDVWEIDRADELPAYALGVLDTALWDLTAKVSNLPLYKVLGGARDRIHAYASTITWSTVQEYLKHIETCLSLGYRAIKLHGYGDLAEDTKLIGTIRNAVGDHVDLMYDGAAAFRYEEALRLGRALEDAGFLWFEEPMREFNIWQYQKLCRDLDIPILAPEITDGAHYNAADFIVQGATDVLRTSAEYKGGITGALRIAHLADAFGMYAEVHGEGLPSIHLSCAFPNTRYYEAFVIEDPRAEREERGELAIDAEGFVRAPERPGIGWRVEVADLEARAVKIE